MSMNMNPSLPTNGAVSEMTTSVPGTIPMNYDKYFSFPNFANSPLPKQFEIQLVFDPTYNVNGTYNASYVILSLVQTISYSEKVSYGFTNYDELYNLLTPDSLGGQNPVEMSKIPDGIKNKVVEHCLNLMKTINTYLNGSTNVTIPLQIPNPSNPSTLVNTNYSININKANTNAITMIVSGYFDGLRKFVDPLPMPTYPVINPSTDNNNIMNPQSIDWNNMTIVQNDPNNKNIPVAIPDLTTYPGDHYYEIAAVDYTQKLHSDFKKKTRLRGFVQVTGHDALGNPVYNEANVSHFGPIIFAKKNIPIRVKLYNLLGIGDKGKLCIPIDHTYMGSYDGPVPNEHFTDNRIVIHLHGGYTPWDSDGSPNQWITPRGENTIYKEGASVIPVGDMPQTQPGEGIKTYYYTNNETCRFMWYHDHSFGTTRANVWMGLVSGYSLTDETEINLMNDVDLPDKDHTIPLILSENVFVPELDQLQISDPTWVEGKNTFFPEWGESYDMWFPHVLVPNQNPNVAAGAHDFGRADYGPWFWPPYTAIKNKPTFDSLGRQYPSVPNPSGVPEAFGDTPLVNGKCYPYLNVERRAYRFTLLNAYNDRTLNLSLFKASSNDLNTFTFDSTGNPINICLDSGETKMVPAIPGQPGFPEKWPTDGREGGVPDPTTIGPSMHLIQNECGFVAKVVELPNQPVTFEYNRRNIVVLDVMDTNLFLCPAERASVVIDFSQYSPGDVILLYNDCPCPNPGFDPRYDYYTGCPDFSTSGSAPSTVKGYGPNSRTLLQFRIVETTKPTSPSMIYNLNNKIQNAYLDCKQDPPLIPDIAYDDVFCQSGRLGDCTLYEMDNYGRIEQNYLTFKNVNNSAIALSNVDQTGKVTTIDIVDGGVEYIQQTTIVKIDPPPTSTQASGSAIVTFDSNKNSYVVSGINIDNAGKGYISAPIIRILAPNATGLLGVPATGIAIIDPPTGQILDIIINGDNYGYFVAPTILINPPTLISGVQAVATAIISNGKIIGVNMVNTGSLYDADCGVVINIDAPPALTLQGTGQAMATCTLNAQGSIASVQMVDTGFGYVPEKLPTVYIDLPFSAYVNNSDIVLSKGYVKNVKTLSYGHGYTSRTQIKIDGGYGDGAVLIPIVSGDKIVSIKIQDNGYGYMLAPTIQIAAPTLPGGTQATAETIIERGQIISVKVTNAGSGYEQIVDVTTGVVTLPEITVISQKPVNYVEPNFTFSRSTGIVNSVAIVNGGYGYFGVGGTILNTLNLVFSTPPQGGVRTAGYAIITNGIITEIVLTQKGSGYRIAPTISVAAIPNVTPVFSASFTLEYIPVGGIYNVQFTTTNGLVNNGSGISSVPKFVITDGYISAEGEYIPGGSGAEIKVDAILCTSIESIRVSNGGSGYSLTNPPKVEIIDPQGRFLTYQLGQPAIQELFDTTWGRMNATFGVEIPNTNVSVQTTIPYGFADPIAPTEQFKMNAYSLAPSRGDSTKIWKLTHNGVDTHSVHFHFVDVQIINRVGWDGMITPPLPEEIGWKESIKMHPLQDTFVATRFVPPKMPYAIPDSIRLNDVTMAEGMTDQYAFTNVDPNGNPITVVNSIHNYGWEYMIHCHLLGHEENDMMRSFEMSVQYEQPYAAILSLTNKTANSVDVNFTFNKNKPRHLSYDPAEYYDIVIERSRSLQTNSKDKVIIADIRGVNRNLTVKSTFFKDTTISPNEPFYFYRIITTNSYGSSYSNIIPLIISSKPSVSCTINQQKRIVLTWTSPIGQTPSNYLLTIYKNNILSSTVNLNANTHTYTYTPIVSDLNKTLEFRVVYVINHIPSPAGILDLFWGVPSAPASLQLGSSSIYWTPYNTTNNLPLTDVSITINNITTSLLLDAAVYNMSFVKNTTYVISLVYSNILGTSTASTFTFNTNVPLSPSNVTYDYITHLLGWTQPQAQSLFPIIDYNVLIQDYIGLALQSETQNVVPYVNTGLGSFVLPYIAGHNYNVFITTRNIYGSSAVAAYTITSQTPSAVTNINVNKTTISWNPVISNPQVTSYNVSITNVDLNTVQTIQTATTSTAWTPQNNVNYSISITANNVIGSSTPTTYIVIFQTPSSVANINVNTTTISWTPVISIPAVTDYTVTITNVGSNNVQTIQTATTSTAWSPQNNVNYSISVVANNINGGSVATTTLVSTFRLTAPSNVIINSNNISWTASTATTSSLFQLANYIMTITSVNTLGASVINNYTIPFNQTSYTNFAAIIGYTYTVSVAAVDTTGQTTAASTNTLYWLLPSAVSSLTYNNTTKTIDWVNGQQVVNAPPIIDYTLSVSYRINGGASVTTSNVINAPITSYPITILYSANYTFTISARNIVGSTNVLSQTFSTFRLTTPSNLVINSNNISWTASTSTTGSLFQLANYVLTLTSVSALGASVTNNYNVLSSQTSYTNFAAIVGYTYTASIVAVDTTGQTTAASTNTLYWLLPSAVSSLTYNNTTKTIDWVNGQQVANAPPIIDYTLSVSYRINGGAAVTTSNVITAPSTSYPIVIVNGAAYTVTISARNIVGSTSVLTATFSTTLPPTPTLVRYWATAGTNVVGGVTFTRTQPKTITWTSGTIAQGTSPITSYTITVRNTQTNTFIINNLDVGLNTNYVFSTATTGGRYSVTVTAINLYGTSTASNLYAFVG